MGRARDTFERHWEAAGLSEGPPAGALADYAEDVLTQIPALRARCHDDDEEKLHALRMMENVASGLLAWIANKPPKPARAAHGTPAPPTPPPRATTRTAVVRDRYRGRTQ